MRAHTQFKQSILAKSIGLMLGTAVMAPAIAQEEAAEVIEVRGLRSSMAESMNTKKESFGVVDAISAEDIGKFPDTNLAESLQRITGVSISRNNGEGSQVTVRGFGAGNNMVTLNGRMMPAAGAFGSGQGTSRAFDFANLASESVRAVEVYKTSKADIATGGIGATINVITAKPLSGKDGFTANVGAKAVMDTTNRTGSDVTPELSGIFSYKSDDATWGVGLTVSHQERDSGATKFEENDWRIDTWVDESSVGNRSGENGTITNAPAVGQLFAMPNNASYALVNTQRVRDNAQLTVQFAPTDDFTATVDYTYANNDIEEQVNSKNMWFTRNTHNVTFDTDQPVATAILISEDTSGFDANNNVIGTKDNNADSIFSAQENTLSSLGLNLEYRVNDSFAVRLDLHNSNMDSAPNAGKAGSQINVATATPIGFYQELDFSTELPGIDLIIDDNAKGNGNGVADIGDVGSQVMRSFWNAQETDISQAKLDGTYEFDEGRFDFGIETRSMEMKQSYSQNYMALGDWGVANPQDIPTELLEEINIMAEFEDYDTSGSDQFGWTSNTVALADWAEGEYNHDYSYNPNLEQNHLVKEDTTALYFQVALNTEIGGMEANFLTGVRYESTDVESTSFSLQNTAIVWADNNDYFYELSDEVTAIVGETSYDHLLPSLDFDLAITDELKARASFSQTIARASYDQMRAAVTGIGTNGPAATGGSATASASNPALVPLQSSNFDLSLEYYYDDSSYVSAGFYEKRVRNFIGTEQVEESHFDLRDATAGPRALAATAALNDLGVQVDETSLFVMTVIMDNPGDFPNGAADYQQGISFAEGIAAAYDVRPNSDDPVMTFLTSKPVNNKDAKIYGFELAAQHFFGETGFGLAANYTTVRGDIGFDDTGSPSVSQFALLGLSDTANVVAMYEGNGFQARLAYNWRDEYLNSTSWGSYRSPEYVEAYAQLDFNVSYQVNDQLSVSFEGLNLTEENSRNHGRSERQIISLYDLGARYQLGARYSF
ncbi:TonB-dependent receptor [Paraglaciecola aquimarina]|uniref:TonB-dependent receptor n=1 Tax=Paraglaciecola aquimarina TaxID=1235557 RepID=A0ABU3SZZ6_9ALTE|nr:TonB-dependent receptor [Paraglaciecola aquimarina]MDU0355497.1 TonB-dependent receptor [Paraglaciecola aquimarina]